MMPRRAPRHRQRGLSGVMIIAVLVVVGAALPFAVGLVTAVNDGHARSLSFARATQAAEAGLDWGRWRIASGVAPACSALQSINTLPGTLRPYTVSLRCQLSVTVNEGGSTLRAYRLEATACNQPLAGQCPNAAANAADYVERRLSTLAHR
jgi:MSHA biogenesis protein MshP